MKRKCDHDRLHELINDVKCRKIVVKGRNTQTLCTYLNAINDMVGLHDLKSFVCDVFFFYVASLPCQEQFRNIAITGKPGCGKTDVSCKLAALIQYLVFNSTKPVPVLCRADLVGQVLGETAVKTSTALQQHTKKCIFIDEVYSLGSTSSDKDIFSKECIDTICAHLSENISTCVMIVAGYHGETADCFFGQNEGLRRRFPFEFQLPPYTPDELLQILQLKLSNFTLQCTEEIRDHIVKCRRETPSFGAAEIMTFINHLMLCHSAAVCYKKTKKTVILKETVAETISFKKPKSEAWLPMYT